MSHNIKCLLVMSSDSLCEPLAHLPCMICPCHCRMAPQELFLPAEVLLVCKDSNSITLKQSIPPIKTCMDTKQEKNNSTFQSASIFLNCFRVDNDYVQILSCIDFVGTKFSK